MNQESRVRPAEHEKVAPDWFTNAIQHRPVQRYFEVEGATINCLDWGADHSNQPGLLFVHGFMAHAQWWSPIAPLFMRNHRVAALDLSGMGDSDHRSSYSRPLHAAEIAQAIRQLNFQQTTIIAHSYGGIPASAALIDDPALADRLVLIDSPVLYRGSPRKDPEGARPRRPYPTLDAALARFRLVPPVKRPLDYYRDFIAVHSLREAPVGWEWKFDWKLRELFTPAPPVELHRLEVDAWVIHGDESEVQASDRARALAAAVGRPNQVVEIPFSDHHIMIEQPLALVAALRAILARDPAPRIARSSV